MKLSLAGAVARKAKLESEIKQLDAAIKKSCGHPFLAEYQPSCEWSYQPAIRYCLCCKYQEERPSTGPNGSLWKREDTYHPEGKILLVRDSGQAFRMRGSAVIRESLAQRARGVKRTDFHKMLEGQRLTL